MIKRKERETLNMILSILASIIIIAAMNSVTNVIVTLIFCMIYGMCILKIIQYGSTYDITKFEFKYTLIVIYMCALFFGIIGGLIPYFIIKSGELKRNE